MSNTATMLRKTEAELDAALSQVAELTKQLAEANATISRLRRNNHALIHSSNHHRMAAHEAQGQLVVAKADASLAGAGAAFAFADCLAHGDFDNRCRGCGERCETVWCVQCAKHARCPHGHSMGECSACDVEGDLAFDAMREGALSGGR